MSLLLALRPSLPESGLRSVLQLDQRDTTAIPDAWLHALMELLRRDVGVGVPVGGSSPLSASCQSQLRDLCGRLGQGGRGLKLALAPDPEQEDGLSQLCGKRRKEEEAESERSPKRFRGWEEEEEEEEGKEREERPKLQSSESASNAGGVLPDTEAEAPETGPGVEEAKGPVESVELPKVVQVLWLGSWLGRVFQQGPPCGPRTRDEGWVVGVGRSVASPPQTDGLGAGSTCVGSAPAALPGDGSHAKGQSAHMGSTYPIEVGCREDSGGLGFTQASRQKIYLFTLCM